MFKNLIPPDTKKTAKKEFNDLVFINFPIGTKTAGIFIGEPVEVWKHWEGEYPHNVFKGECMGDNCVLCQDNIPKRYSFEVNFITLDKDTGKPIMTIAQGPASLAATLLEKQAVKGDDFFTNTLVMVNRTDKTAFLIDDIKPPAAFGDITKLVKSLEPFDLTAIHERLKAKQLEKLDKTTEVAY